MSENSLVGHLECFIQTSEAYDHLRYRYGFNGFTRKGTLCFLTKRSHKEDLKILVRMVCEMLQEETNPGLADGQVKAFAAKLDDLSSNPWD